MKMMMLPASSSLNFLAGIFAGAGINLVTSIATGPEGDVSTGKVVLDSAFWVLTAAFLTWAAQVLQNGERDADLDIDRDFSEAEKQDIRQLNQRRALRQALLPLVLTGASFFVSLLLLPRLVRWSDWF
ncbi:hypothetical protein [Actinoplanes sp. HUAS TT8]|uniref:hypothetical protein n=1 Tax=Actinoplanes sp. HUAS TT8 TaxID=3447453 RepID=UPI003F523459